MAQEQPDDRPTSVDDEAILFDQGEEGPSEAIPEEITWADPGTKEWGPQHGVSHGVSTGRSGPPRIETDFQALLTGMLIGACMRESAWFDEGLKIDMTQNEDGVYNPWFTVTTKSGQRAVVTVTALT